MRGWGYVVSSMAPICQLCPEEDSPVPPATWDLRPCVKQQANARELRQFDVASGYLRKDESEKLALSLSPDDGSERGIGKDDSRAREGPYLHSGERFCLSIAVPVVQCQNSRGVDSGGEPYRR